jgi:hypothetical protein
MQAQVNNESRRLTPLTQCEPSYRPQPPCPARPARSSPPRDAPCATTPYTCTTPRRLAPARYRRRPPRRPTPRRRSCCLGWRRGDGAERRTGRLGAWGRWRRECRACWIDGFHVRGTSVGVLTPQRQTPESLILTSRQGDGRLPRSEAAQLEAPLSNGGCRGVWTDPAPAEMDGILRCRGTLLGVIHAGVRA